jgi:hypothetical protein
MQMMVNLGWVSHVMDLSASSGNMPAELHMNQATYDAMVETMKSAGQKPPAVRWQGEKRIEGPWRFRNVPLVVNDKLPTEGVLVRPLGAMSDPNWIDKFASKMKEDMERRDSITPPEATIPRAEPAPGEVNSSSALRDGVETPTDVLIGAATNCDDVDTAIVIMSRGRRSEVEIRSNAKRFEIIGLLQAALSRIAQDE